MMVVFLPFMETKLGIKFTQKLPFLLKCDFDNTEKSLWRLLLPRFTIQWRYLSENHQLQPEQQTGRFCPSNRLCIVDKRQHEIKGSTVNNSRLKLIFMADFLENVLSGSAKLMK